MKEQPSAYSPFAALDTREKMEQWIWWQCQKPRKEEHTPVQETCVLPELEQHTVQKNEPAPAAPKAQAVAVPPIRHGQYDAVIRRMHTASKQATNYIAWTE